MTTKDDNGNSVNTWVKTRNAIGIALLVVVSYEMGLGHARSERSAGEYSALKAQYNQIETEYAALKTQYNQIETQDLALKAQYEQTETQYAALKAQYDRIEAHGTGSTMNHPKK
jgi:septal ring factor EnvC (AmiA/AmiB activator)